MKCFDTLIQKWQINRWQQSGSCVGKGIIKAVASEINEPAREVIDLSGNSYLSAGWIDDHVHCYEKMNLYYDYPDQIGVQKGVTTVIDAGTTGAEKYSRFLSTDEIGQNQCVRTNEHF